MKLKQCIAFIGGLVSIIACSNCYDDIVAFPDNFVFDSVEQIDLSDPQIVSGLPIGLMDVKIIDSLCLFATMNNQDGFYKISKLPGFKPVGQFIHAGNGPSELKRSLHFSLMTFRVESDSLQVYLPDNKRNLIRWNVSKTLADGKVQFLPVATKDDPNCFKMIKINDSTIFCHGLDQNGVGMCRYLLNNGKPCVPPHFSVLNAHHVTRQDNYTFNILNSIISYNEKLQRIVEVGRVQNVINIYDLKGEFYKTIQIGPALTGIIEKNPDTWPDAYVHLKVYDTFFAALYLGAVESLSTEVFPKIRFIDWDGKPLLEVPLEMPATAFDVDFNSGTLYTLDADSESVFAYDVSGILGKFLN